MAGAGSPNLIAIGFFVGFIALSLGITWVASRRTHAPITSIRPAAV